MSAARDYIVVLMVLFAMMTDIGAKGSYSEDGTSVTQRGHSESGGPSLYPTTRDTDREVREVRSLVTTAPTLNAHNHHPLYKGFLLQESLQGQRHFFEDSGGVETHPAMPPSGPHYARDPSSTHTVPHKDALVFSGVASTTTAVATAMSPLATKGSVAPEGRVSVNQRVALTNGRGGRTEEADAMDTLTTPVMHTSAPSPRSNTPNMAAPMGDMYSEVPTASTMTPPALTTLVEQDAGKSEEHNMSHASDGIEIGTSAVSGAVDEETTSTTITTTTNITTMHHPAPCIFNLTSPEGYIETPQPSSSHYYSSVDCTYTVTVYMGYGVEIQVMNVSLWEGEQVTFEDLGGGEPSVLANESILLKGLVVRSWSNHITIHFHSQRQTQPGSFLLRYQAFVLSCTFPQRPACGDVSVSSLHSGGEAYFYCLTGYHLQGTNTLTCLNASTPYWSGTEPQCHAACGGIVRNATVGRIVSPGFPGNYSNNLTCHWLLEAPEGQRVHVHFEKMALAEDDDRLLIKNGKNIDSPPLYDSYEVEYLPNEGLVSTSRSLFIELTTDGAGTSTGIAIRYQAFAVGHCYEPFVKYGNFTSNDSTWAVGTVVEFTCDPGYTLEQGSVIIECMDHNNPQWNETEPACRAVCSGEMTDSAGVVLSPNWPEAYDSGQDCIWGIHVEEDRRLMLDIQVLNIGKNDLLTFYDGDDLTAKVLGQYGGSRPHFKIYTSMADVTIQFQSDPATNIYGYGNGFVVHFFEVPRNDTCPELPEITNGWKSTSHPELVHGTVVTYQCYPGFQLVGTELLMCQWDLTWSGDLPSCERVLLCADPGTVEHSRRVMSGPRFTVGSTVQYICNKGNTLSGNSLLSCYNHGSSGPKWSERLPKCVSVNYEPCRNPGTPSYSTQISEKPLYQAGETLSFSCLRGHELLGEPVLRCVPGHPSQWSSLPPVCRASSIEFISERRLGVASADYSMEGANIALTVFIPVALIMVFIIGIYLYFSKVQRKPMCLPMSTSLPYDHIPGESTFDNSLYETETTNNEDTREYEVSI
ncbi:seizure protein 6 homolog isoform X1 [Salvelinus namaycush]|uniref:Seizure protein 6 homolog isoform X1 n=1 Tax=Salvelinus namaycush TaxID=8040 RepID=A0A8U0TIP3_SALNM|nr:seizure protein 6 homolog isoform X1 [Salvelinus namaycush]